MTSSEHFLSSKNWRALIGLSLSLVSLVLFILGNFTPFVEESFFKLWAVAIIFSLLAIASSLSSTGPSKTSRPLDKASRIFSYVVGGIHIFFILFLLIAVIFFEE